MFKIVSEPSSNGLTVPHKVQHQFRSSGPLDRHLSVSYEGLNGSGKHDRHTVRHFAPEGACHVGTVATRDARMSRLFVTQTADLAELRGLRRRYNGCRLSCGA